MQATQPMRATQPEHCYWPVDWRADIPAHCRHVYLGDECCGQPLRDAGFARRLRQLQGMGYAVSLVAPLLTPGRQRQLAALLEAIPQPLEVVASDLGAFALAGQTHHMPVVGRLLSRQHSDPAIAAFAAPAPPRLVQTAEGPRQLRHRPPGEELRRHFQTPAIFAPATLAVLRSLTRHPLRVELDMPPQGLPHSWPQDVQISLHAAEAVLAVRGCGGEGEECAACPAGAVPAGRTRDGTWVHRRRQLYFYPTHAESYPARASRLLWRAPLKKVPPI